MSPINMQWPVSVSAVMYIVMIASLVFQFAIPNFILPHHPSAWHNTLVQGTYAGLPLLCCLTCGLRESMCWLMHGAPLFFLLLLPPLFHPVTLLSYTRYPVFFSSLSLSSYSLFIFFFHLCFSSSSFFHFFSFTLLSASLYWQFFSFDSYLLIFFSYLFFSSFIHFLAFILLSTSLHW